MSSLLKNTTLEAKEDLPEATANGLCLHFDMAPQPTDEETLINVVVKAPTASERRPVNIVAVVDVSGSMASKCSIENADGKNDGLTRLDLTRHSVNTIVAALKDEDQFALITFSNDTVTAVPPTKMTAAGRESAMAAIKNLKAGGGTQLWKGVAAGVNLATSLASAGRTTAVMLLTDGVPSDRGHMQELNKLLRANPDIPSKLILSTFGFGYSLDSELLDKFAHRFGGLYTFVPDASIVGTAFVNNLSNILAIAEQGVQIELAAGPDMEITKVYGAFNGTPEHKFSLGPVMYGQDRSVVVAVKPKSGSPPGETSPLLRVTLRGESGDCAAIATGGTCSVDAEATLLQKYRLQFGPVVASQAALNQFGQGATSPVGVFSKEVKSSMAAKHAGAVALCEDLDGQVTEAFSRGDWFTKWGKHYLLSLSRSHLLQQCTNFKDPGLQQYGGPVFEAARDECDDIFISLPPPTPSISHSVGASGAAQRAAPVDMSTYYNAGGG